MIIYQNADGSWTLGPDFSGTGPFLVTAPNTDSNDAYRQGVAYVNNWQQVIAVGPTGLYAIVTTLNTGTTGVSGSVG